MTPEQLQQGTELQSQISKTERQKEAVQRIEAEINGTRTVISVSGKNAKVISADLIDFLQGQQTKAQNKIDTLQTQFDEL